MDYEPKIGVAEAFIVLATLGIIDAADLAFILLGIPASLLFEVAEFPITQFYFRMKGVRGNYMLIGNLVGFIPYIGQLPTRTIGAAATIWRDRHPKALPTPENAEGSAIPGNVVRPKFGDEAGDESEAA